MLKLGGNDKWTFIHEANSPNTKVATVGNDKIIWPHDSKWMFTIKSFYMEVCVELSNFAFPADAIWRSKAPTKACFMAWQLPRGKCLQKICLREEI